MKRRILISILAFAVMWTMSMPVTTFVAKADTPYFPYSNKTVADYGGDYSLFYILNNYNIYTKENTDSGHCVGPAAVGGTAKFDMGMGFDGLKYKYEHTTPSYFEGEMLSDLNGMYPMELYVGEVNADNENCNPIGTLTFNGYTSKNDKYIDFNAAYSDIQKEVNAIAGLTNKIVIDPDVTKADHYEIVDSWGGMKQVNVDSGYIYEFKEGTADQYRIVNILGDGDAVFICNDSGKAHMPDAYLDGEYDWSKFAPEGSDGQYGGTSGVVFIYPNATEIDRSWSYQSSNGHV
ncbi:MAG: hypothetical protein HUJ76_12375, partial [Parasporobacterium sp.]|nr:hypothetical protein [Parasporobacterium sp.]